MSIFIVSFDPALHREAVVSLWQSVFGYEGAHNEPNLSIAKKLQAGDGLFFVAETDGTVSGSIMAGYDGHRGWLYSLAVLPEYRGQGIGSSLVGHAERALMALGCMKINLQVMPGNEGVLKFYDSLGYSVEARTSMGKRIPENVASELGT